MATKKANKAVTFGHVMIDLETLGKVADSAILSIGAVRFNGHEIDDDAFYRVITIESNLDSYRTLNASTIRWWMRQDEAAKRDLFAEDSAGHAVGGELTPTLNEFRKWFSETPDAKAYGNGSDFDLAMLAHAYSQLGQDAPWKFWNSTCFRTLKSQPAARAVPKPALPTVAHNALADAHAQALHLQAIWRAA
jgi:exodeoxyribonuclease VIII